MKKVFSILLGSAALAVSVAGLRAQAQLSEFDEKFKAFDQNSDGIISGDEMNGARYLPRLDLNKDGKLTREEALEATQKMRNLATGAGDVLTAGVFKRMDKNGDGKLTADQIAIIRAHPQWIDTDNDGVPDALEKAIGTNWKKADTDGDGFSDGVELKSGYNPLAKNKKLKPSAALIKRLKGKVLLEVKSGILLKVDSKGVVSLY